MADVVEEATRAILAKCDILRNGMNEQKEKQKA